MLIHILKNYLIDNSKTVHQKNLQRLAIEMYKAKNNLSRILYNICFPDRMMFTILDIRERLKLQTSEQFTLEQKLSDIEVLKYGNWSPMT